MELQIVDQPDFPVSPDQGQVSPIEESADQDVRRLKVTIDLIPCRISPDIDLVVFVPTVEDVSSTRVTGSIDGKSLPGLYLSRKASPGYCAAQVSWRCQEVELVHREEVHFTFPQVIAVE